MSTLQATSGPHKRLPNASTRLTRPLSDPERQHGGLLRDQEELDEADISRREMSMEDERLHLGASPEGKGLIREGTDRPYEGEDLSITLRGFDNSG